MSSQEVKPIWYGGRLFRVVKSNGASHTNRNTIFKYEQRGWMVLATYSGGDIEFGQMIGVSNPENVLDMRYQHRGTDGRIFTGICITEPQILEGNKLRLHESWQWTCGDRSHGTSTLEEI